MPPRFSAKDETNNVPTHEAKLQRIAMLKEGRDEYQEIVDDYKKVLEMKTDAEIEISYGKAFGFVRSISFGDQHETEVKGISEKAEFPFALQAYHNDKAAFLTFIKTVTENGEKMIAEINKELEALLK